MLLSKINVECLKKKFICESSFWFMFVFDADEVLTLEFLHDLGSFLEHGLDQGFGHEDVARLFSVWMHGLQQHIVDIGTHAERGVAEDRASLHRRALLHPHGQSLGRDYVQGSSRGREGIQG